MILHKTLRPCVAVILLSFFVGACSQEGSQASAAPNPSAAASGTLLGANVLVFSHTVDYRHGSIPAGIDMFEAMALESGFTVTATEDPSVFADAKIEAFDAIVFLNTSGDVLNERQQRAFERYIQSGGGYVGIHSASDTERDGSWPWYTRLVGAVFDSHPVSPSNVQRAQLSRATGAEMLTEGIPGSFAHIDEWYDFSQVDPTTQPVLFIDRDSYADSSSSGQERIAWFHEYDGGRAFYTNLGHTEATFQNELFQRHLLNGLAYAVGDRQRKPILDGRPDPDRFVKDILAAPLGEPVSLDVLPDGSVLLVERSGNIKYWREGKEIENVGSPSKLHYPGERSEFGLLALAAIPHDRAGPLEGSYFMYNTLLDEQVMQRVSYAPFRDGRFDFDDERVLLDIPTDPNCCHTGGSIRFGPDGYLYVAVGDNSAPGGSDGMASPLSDDILARDARRSSGNTNDLRGKILRIDPSTDGAYRIPKGNLFAETEKHRPEIYVMGTRNPYTLGFDDAEGTLFFGDVGPDAHNDSELGPMGYDEVNRVQEAGNFGWPYFIGDNRPYPMFKPDSDRPAPLFDPLAPVNESPRNTGSRTLPPAQPALIAYPYAISEKFPELGTSSRNVLVAGVYRRPENTGPGAWPPFFEGKLIIGDYARRFLKAVTIDEDGQAIQVTSIAQDIELSAPLDLEFGPDGALYIVEYGTGSYTDNPDSRLSRIRYLGDGNRAPRLTLAVDRVAGAVPLAIQAQAMDAYDPDGDDFRVEWTFAPAPEEPEETDPATLFGSAIAEGNDTQLTIDQPGRHIIIARATDAHGAAAYSITPVDAGNERPEVSIDIEGNRTFFWPDRDEISYQVNVTDAEDGSSSTGDIPSGQITVHATVALTSEPKPPVPPGHPGQGSTTGAPAKDLLVVHGCNACHAIDKPLVGPAYEDVAARYMRVSNASDILDKAITEGSSGKWGDRAMPPHGSLDPSVRAELIRFILGPHEVSVELPSKGSIVADEFIREEGQFVRLTARYTDRGSDKAAPLTGSAEVSLRSNTINLHRLVQWHGEKDGIRMLGFGERMLLAAGNGATLPMGEYDLTGISGVTLGWSHNGMMFGPGKVRVELHMGRADGNLLASDLLDIKAGGGHQTGNIPLIFDTSLEGMHNLFLLVLPVENVTDKTRIGLTRAVFNPR